MASSSTPSCCFCCSSSSSPKNKYPIIITSSSTHFALSLSNNFTAGFSLKRDFCSFKTFAKFDKFQNDHSQDTPLELSSPSSQTLSQQDEKQEEDDSCLPSDLEGAVRQSGEASASFMSSGGMRAIVELLIPQLQFLDDEGAQEELWNLSRVFVETLMEETGGQVVKAIFPDAGAAALLRYRWKDAAFGFASLSDRKPIETEDEIVVMVVPDYQMLESVKRITSSLSDDPPRPLIMWNPRLISEEVGVGINVRNLRKYFLRPLPTGAVFRCYPGLWKVFNDDKDRLNRYLLARELIRRPDSEELELIFGNVAEESDEDPSFFVQAAGFFSSLSRLIKAIAK